MSLRAGGLTGLMNQPTAQVIDGSLKFDDGPYLKFTPSSTGNRRTFTLSYWVKRNNFGQHDDIFGADDYSSSGDFTEIRFDTNDRIQLWLYGTSTSGKYETTSPDRRFRDTGWYHIVVAVDSTQTDVSNRVKLYINGELYDVTGTSTNIGENEQFRNNLSGQEHLIGYYPNAYAAVNLSNFYGIDGLALGPRFFGFNDPLTGTWRPRKLKDGDISLNDGTVWSSGIPGNVLSGYPATNAFDGNTSTFVYADNNSTMTWTTPTPVSGKKIEVYAYAGNTHPILNVNGQSTGAVVGGTAQHNVWVDVTHLCPGGNLETIQAFGQNIGGVDRSSGWSAVRVDGEILIDRKVFNSKNPNNGTTWSNSLTTNAGDNFDGSGAKTKAFDGNGSNKAFTANNSDGTTQGTSYLEMVFPSAINGALRVKCDNGNTVRNTTDGGDVLLATQSTGSDNQFVDCGTVSGLTNLRVLMSGGSRPAISMIELDGYVFIDGTNDNSFYLPFDGNSPIGQDKSGRGNDWTPVNFGGSAGVDQASGALPILEGAGGAVASVGVRTDAYSSYLTLALPLVGSANDESNRINSGSTAKTVSVSGDPASSTLQSNFYGASFYFDGSANSDYVSVADNDQLDVGSGDFTIECWAYVSGYPNNNPGLLSKRGGNGAAHWQLVLNRNGQIQFGDQATWTNYFGTSSGTTGDQIFKDNWHHIAITRTSGSVQAWYDGRKYGTAITNTTDFSTSANFSVGVGREDNYDPFQGYVNDVRVYKGVAKYTDSFVPASTSPDILPDTPSGVAGGSKLTKITEGAVSFDGSGDSLVCADSADWDFGTGDFTIECFAYFNDTTSVNSTMINRWTDIWTFQIVSSSQNFRFYAGASDNLATASNTIGPNKWYHFAASRSSGTLKLFIDGVESASSSFTKSLSGSVPLNIGAENSSQNLPTNGFISNVRIVNGTALYTSSFTPPTEPLTNVTNTKLLCCRSTIEPGAADVAPNVSGSINTGTQWSNYLVSPNYAFMTNNPPSRAFNGLNTYGQTPPNGATPNGRQYDGGSNNNPPSVMIFTPPGGLAYSSEVSIDYECYGPISIELNGTEVISLSGPAKTASGFSALASGSGTITQIKITSSGASGDYVSLYAIKVDGTVLTDPIVPNGDAATTNFNPFNTDINTVRGQETGYCTLNPLDTTLGTNLRDGNLKTVGNSSWSTSHARGTVKMTSGKWFWEGTKSGGSGAIGQFGFSNSSASLTESYSSAPANSWTFYFGNGTEIIVPAANSGSYFSGSAMANGDTAGVALDMDNGTWQFFKNGVGGEVKTLVDTDSGSTVSITELYPYVGSYSSDFELNFGQKPFKFPPPDGFQPLNATNVRPETVISRPDQYVGIITYVGAGATKTFTGLNFGDVPDLVWMKNRDRTSYGDGTSAHNYLYDTVRGTGTGKMLTSSTTESQGSKSTEADLDGFVRDGFRLDAASGTDCINNSGDNFVAWCWKAGGKDGSNAFNIDGVGYASAAAAGLTGGDIPPVAASVGTKQGFSIIQYQGNGSTDQTIPHGLTQAPDFSIIKNMDGTANWTVFHRSATTTTQKVFYLNTNAAIADYSGGDSTWWGTLPGASVFTIGATSTAINNGTNDMISYHWHNVPGLQKFGSYTGGGSSYPFVELGFRPVMIWIKNTSTGGTHYDWSINDSKRNPFNLGADNTNSKDTLFANTNDQENKGSSPWQQIDFLSNGFRINDSSVSVNQSGSTFVYCAWAEAPVSNLYGGSSNGF